MISPEADNRLRALSAELKQAMGVIVERAIMQYQPIETDQPGDKEDRLLALESRVMALEASLEELRAVGVVSMPEVESVAAIADLAPSVATVDVSGETVDVEQPDTASGFNQDIAAFKAAVVEYWNAGMKEGYAPIAKVLEDRGSAIATATLIHDLNVMNVLRKAKLVGRKMGRQKQTKSGTSTSKGRANLLPPWKPGQSGNPAGRPIAARQRLTDAFIKDLSEHYSRCGAEIITRVAEQDPVAYLNVVARFIPKETELTINSNINLTTSRANAAHRRSMDRCSGGY